MYQICKFNKDTDLCKTVPGLSTDLGLAIDNGVVLDTGIDANYNDVDDPARIRGRVRDAFQAVDLQRSVLAAGKVSDKLSPSSGKVSDKPAPSSSVSTSSGANE